MPASGRQVVVGFDSAWMDNPRKPGAIAACVFQDGVLHAFHEPRPAGFDQALELIEKWSSGAAYLLVAIDQPIVVPNPAGCRAVERVAGSVVCRLQGGVQPARREGGGAPMFGDHAPIWRFLKGLGALQHPIGAQNAREGRYLMEVFPALSLPAIVPELWRRRRGAKYNPIARNFLHDDWTLVTAGAAAFAEGLEAGDLVSWLRRQGGHAKPRKGEQDALDAALCLCIALSWRRARAEDSVMLGTLEHGYIVTVTSAELNPILAAAARKNGVKLYHPASEPSPGPLSGVATGEPAH